MSNPNLLEARRLAQGGHERDAAGLYRQVLKGEPRNFEALCALAVIAFRARDFADAEHFFAKAVAVDPRSPETQCFYGVALLELRRVDDALAAFEAALAVNPRYGDALVNRATALLELGRKPEALQGFQQALSAQPNQPKAWNNLGNCFLQMERFPDAIAAYDRALHLDPSFAQAWFNRASALIAMRRYTDAASSLDRAVSLVPPYAEAWFLRGHVLTALKKYGAALGSYDKSLGLGFHPAGSQAGRAAVLFQLGRIEDAIAAAETALRADPNFPLLPGSIAYWRRIACDWRGFDQDRDDLARRLDAGEYVAEPFGIAVMSDDPARQRRAAEIWTEREVPPLTPLYKNEAYAHDKIRLAYISADFRDHATATLIAGLFEHHDRDRFELTALSLARSDDGPMRARLMKSFDRFIDADAISDAEAAKALRDLEIDIVVDLKGFTTDARPVILSSRPAPVQVSYLGYPAAMGKAYVDYLVADRTVIPPGDEKFFSECIAFLPDCYQVNDSTRAPVTNIPSRAEAGLPEAGFVFAAFNASYKITPAMFGCWMRILDAAPGSLLWLLAFNPPMVENLKREAEKFGIAPERLIFAPHLAAERHLARFALADLFLDTLPCNAHTTASEALWAGVPVLTLPGTTFAGRVASSILKAARIPDLIAASLDDYQAMAIAFARKPERVAAIKAQLKANLDTTSLFDTKLFTRRLEAAFTTMHRRHRDGLPPENFAVEEDL